MTDKELKRLSRAELLKMLIEQSKEVERLRQIIKQNEEELQNKKILLNEAGSIAEASLKINKVFESAQQAADQYLANVSAVKERQAAICAQMEKETRKKCNDMIAKTKMEAKAYLEEVSKKVDAYLAQHTELKDSAPNDDKKSE